ncbi:hypothetical protein BH20PSE1_BH20PSE1_00960 [soil metagenome]
MIKHLGWLYTVEHIRDGRVLSVERVHNLAPLEAREYLLSVGANAGSQITTWYCGIFEGNYTPIDSNTMANFPGLATECVAYDEASRPEWVEAAPSAGNITNSASKAVFTINASKTIYGAFLSSSAVKSGVAGKLLSTARFATAKVMDAGEILRVTGTIQSVSTS